MRIKITKGGIYNAKGEEIAVGTELTVKEEPLAWAGRYETISGGSTSEVLDDDKTKVMNPQGGGKPVAPFVAKETGAGWYKVVDANNRELGKSLRLADAEAFNAMSDEDKATYVDDLAAEA